MPRSQADHQVGCRGFRQISRRHVMQVGVCGALGLSLANLLRIEARADAEKPQPRARSIIQLHLPGGLPQQESFDPKPEAPLEYRGAFGTTRTKHGEFLSENMPKTAAIANKLTVIRSLVGRIPDHVQATYHLFTGYTPTPAIDYPQMGSIVLHELGSRGELPSYVSIPNNHSYAGSTGYLSSTYGAFDLHADPAQPNFRVRDLALPEGISLDRFNRQRSTRDIIERRIRGLEADPTTLDAMDDFYKRAYALLTSQQARAAFSLEQETEATYQLYGRDVVGLLSSDNRRHPKGLAEKLMLARRLVEAGTRFVTVTYGEWDSHVDTKTNCLDQLPALDHAIAGLVTDLAQRGLLETTILWVTTEFGRTPKINYTSGRDHWARCYSHMIAGGGFASGLIYGVSNSTGAEPVRDAIRLEDLQFTIYKQLGIDASKELLAGGSRPVKIVKDGKFVAGLLG